MNHKKNNGIINFKELKRNWETNIILCLIVVSAYMVGIFTGSMNWNAAYNGFYHPVTTSTPPVLAPSETDTLDTEMTTNFDWMGDYNASDHLEIKFTGRIIETNAPVNTFECSLNDEEFEPCTSPYHTNHLIGDYDYMLVVRAVNGSAVDHTPAVWMWSVHD